MAAATVAGSTTGRSARVRVVLEQPGAVSTAPNRQYVILLARNTMFPIKGVANDEDKAILDGNCHIGGDLAAPGPGGERAASTSADPAL